MFSVPSLCILFLGRQHYAIPIRTLSMQGSEPKTFYEEVPLQSSPSCAKLPDRVDATMESLVSNTICVIGNTISTQQELLRTFHFIDDPNSAFDGRKANKSGLQNRRGALRKGKVHGFRGHEFLAKFFRQPVFCSVCMEFCW